MHELHKDLDLQYKSILGRVFEKNRKQLHVFRCDYGVKFEEKAKNMDPFIVRDIKERCRQFLLKLSSEMEKRLPANKGVFKDITMFDSNRIFDVQFCDLPFWEFCNNHSDFW